MLSLAQLRECMGLPARRDAPVETVQDALRLCPERPASEVLRAAGALALKQPDGPGLALVLAALREAATASNPEGALAELLADWTGGRVEIHASWGDLVATAGRVSGSPVKARRGAARLETVRLEHAGRHVGSLTLAVSPGLDWLSEVAAGFVLLARLQAAAAGAARRRAGERLLDAALTGDPPAAPNAPYAVAVAALTSVSQSSGLPVAERDAALDVLAAVGEGYLSGRRLGGAATVRAGQAVWLWQTLNLSAEGRELHAALTASTAQDVRLGVSAAHDPRQDARPAAAVIRAAHAEAVQALTATRAERGYTPFHAIDPLSALLGDRRLTLLQTQVSAQLATLGDGGRAEATLRAYLAHPGPLAALARRLGLHPNTVRNHLRRAEDALGARLSDPALLARLYLAFRTPEDGQTV